MDFPVDDTIQITFSEAVLKPSFESGFALTDSSGLAVNGIFLWKNSMAVSFLPKPPLKYEMEYKLRIALDSVVDFSGNHSDDSTVVTPFQTVDERALSSIEGTVFDDSTHARGKIFITAMNISNKTVKSKTVVVDTPSVFMFSGLFEGEYTLSAFRDADSNGMYSYGTPFPFVSAERFTIYPDTLKLRARWPLEGVRLHFH
jgi:uncharacterized protein (DUF2141 family)